MPVTQTGNPIPATVMAQLEADRQRRLRRAEADFRRSLGDWSHLAPPTPGTVINMTHDEFKPVMEPPNPAIATDPCIHFL